MIEKLMQLPWREKAGLVFALALVALYVTDATVAKPLVRRVRRLDTAISVEQQRLDLHRKTLAYADSVRQQYAGVKDLIGVAGPEQEDIETFKNEIDEMALRNAIRLKAMRHLPPERTAFLVTYVVEVNDFEADIAALVNFLHTVGQAPGLLRVRQTAIAAPGTDTVVSGSMVITKVMARAADGGTP